MTDNDINLKKRKLNDININNDDIHSSRNKRIVISGEEMYLVLGLFYPQYEQHDMSFLTQKLVVPITFRSIPNGSNRKYSYL